MDPFKSDKQKEEAPPSFFLPCQANAPFFFFSPMMNDLSRNMTDSSYQNGPSRTDVSVYFPYHGKVMIVRPSSFLFPFPLMWDLLARIARIRF